MLIFTNTPNLLSKQWKLKILIKTDGDIFTSWNNVTVWNETICYGNSIKALQTY